jgi:hypothetical protein
LNLRLRFDRD